MSEKEKPRTPSDEELDRIFPNKESPSFHGDEEVAARHTREELDEKRREQLGNVFKEYATGSPEDFLKELAEIRKAREIGENFLPKKTISPKQSPKSPQKRRTDQ